MEVPAGIVAVTFRSVLDFVSENVKVLIDGQGAVGVVGGDVIGGGTAGDSQGPANCDGGSREHPTLTVFHWFTPGHQVLLHDFGGAGPGVWRGAVVVVAVPFTFQKAAVIHRIDLEEVTCRGKLGWSQKSFTTAEMALVTIMGEHRSAGASPDFSNKNTAEGREISSNWPKIHGLPVGFLKVPHQILPFSFSTYSFRSSSFPM